VRAQWTTGNITTGNIKGRKTLQNNIF